MENTIKIIKKYFQIFPEDKKDLSILERQMEEEKDLFDRKNFTGHIVANSLILNGKKILTIFHNKLQMYIQPGGHVDKTDVSVVEAAIREIEEETGIKDVVLNNWHKKTGTPIFIESHLIPEDGKEQEMKHYHHDFMYVFKTKTKDVDLQLKEVSGFEWVAIENILKNNPESFIGRSLERMLKLKLLE